MERERNHCKDMELHLTMELSCHLENKRMLNGRYESVLSKLMKQTDTNIFCPTSDMNLNITTRIPKITISGSLAAVESARLSIRECVPVVFVVSCRSDKVQSLGINLLVAHFSSTFGVKLVFNLVEEDACYQVNIRGHHYRFEFLKEAVSHFCHLVQTPSESVEMEINSSCLHIGLVRNCIPLIEKKSGARICCPVNGSLVLVRGSLEATYFASEIITGVTPLYLKFQLSSSEITERVRSIARQMDISISSINIDSGINELVLSTYEWNTRHLYEIRRIILGLPSTASIFPKQRPLWTNLVGLPKSFYRSVECTIFEPQCEELTLEGHRNSTDETLNLRRI
ncbi:uncharacterized protein LOC124328354 isoform X1 [Daphnia pulicaria]|uniref:uncharacterized protein LOC124328354 isoform X1 n=1 Tax=Daphnia pulicaria TaxID=35523 RepID=UPI001EEACE6B|nr:uncharacterized protein LOC124328354 isoform X1 [Daphnia pulicaria]